MTEQEGFYWPLPYDKWPKWFKTAIRNGWAWFEADKLVILTPKGDLRVRQGIYIQNDCGHPVPKTKEEYEKEGGPRKWIL